MWIADQGVQVLGGHGFTREHPVETGAAEREVTQGCIEILGPMGISREPLLEKGFRDVRIPDIDEGTGEIQRMIVARALLGDSRADRNQAAFC